MDATDSIDTACLAPLIGETGKDHYAVPVGTGRRRLRARTGAAALSITSDLDPHEPVTEAEIRLILAALGDTISQFIDPKASRCSTSPNQSDA
jgi:hypothetical protein